MTRVRVRLAAEYQANGTGERFALLEQFLPGEESDPTYAEAGAHLGVAERTIKSDVHRLKKRYRDLLRAEIAHTVGTPAEIDEELRHLLTVCSRAWPALGKFDVIRFPDCSSVKNAGCN